MVDELQLGLGRGDIFLVEHIERRQGNVGDFFLTKRYVVVSGIPRNICYRRYGYG